MIPKIKTYLDNHPKEAELLRYLIAGGLTTLLSFLIFSSVCIAFSPDHTVDGAPTAVATGGQSASWVVAVLFAFWINRRMVFQQEGGTTQTILKELSQFIAGRLASYLIIELGLFTLLSMIGVGNLINKGISLVLVMIFNYVISKFWIFNKKT